LFLTTIYFETTIKQQFAEHILEDSLARFFLQFVAYWTTTRREIVTPSGEAGGTKMVFTCFATNWINKDFETYHAFA